jgi:hypothetical protein
MKKVTTLVLMLCLVFSGALCYAHDIARTEKEKVKGIPLEVKEKVLHGSFDKSSSIVPTLDGHMLTVVFTENLGQVSIEITTSTGGYVQANSCLTPNGLQFYISPAGDYIVTFTLPNGDEYYGEFTVTD